MSNGGLGGIGLTALLGVAACQLQIGSSEEPPPAPQAVSPSVGYRGEAQAVSITGEHFLPLVQQDLSLPDGLRIDSSFRAWLGDTELESVEYLDDGLLAATVPVGIVAGRHDLRLETPRGLTGTLGAAYVALEIPIPSVDQVIPGDLVNDAPSEVEVLGSHFAEGLSAELLMDSAEPIPLTVVQVSSESFSAEVPSGAEPGIYSLRVLREDGAPGRIDGAIRVWAPAALSASVTLSRTEICVGQPLAVAVWITNDGGSGAIEVAPGPPVAIGSGRIRTPLGPFPRTASIGEGQRQDFLFSLTPYAAGTVEIEADGTGLNLFSGRPVASPRGQSPVLSIREAAALEVAVAAAPPAVPLGEQVVVTVTVRNTGGLPATAVTPLLAPSATASIVHVAGPVPADATLPAGESQDFTFTYDAVQPAVVSFVAAARGFDTECGGGVSSEEPAAVDVSVLGLLLDWTDVPAQVASGAAFYPVLTATNVGESGAMGVAPASLSVSGSTGTICAGSDPVSADIPANGGEQQFTFTCAAGGSPGPAEITVAAAGIDEVTRAPLPAAAVTSVPVMVSGPTGLAITWSVPQTLAYGQEFTAVLSATNYSGQDLQDVAPTSLTVTGATGTVCGAATPVVADLAMGTEQEFAFACTAGGVPGVFELVAGAEGTAVASGLPVAADALPSIQVRVLAPAQLSIAAVEADDEVVTQGESARVITMIVENTGGSSALVESDGSLITFARGTTDVSADYSQVVAPGNPTLILPGQSALFAFEVDIAIAARAGVITLGGTIAGTDELSEAPVMTEGADLPGHWVVRGAPHACLTADAVALHVGESISVDAGCSTDDQEPRSALSVEWDWEGDGTLDTVAASELTATHTFASSGIHRVAARVTDSGGSAGYADLLVAVADTSSSITTVHLPEDFDTALHDATPNEIITFGGPMTVDDPGRGLWTLPTNDVTVIGREGVSIFLDKEWVVEGARPTLVNLAFAGAGSRACLVFFRTDGGPRLLGNHFEGCTTAVTIWSSPSEVGPDNTFVGGDFGVDIVAGDGHVVIGNTFTGNSTAALRMTPQLPARDLLMVGNLLVGGERNGLVTNSTVSEVHIYHNTFDGFANYGVNLFGAGHHVVNNIFTSNVLGAVCDHDGALGAETYDYNILYLNGPAEGCEPTPSGTHNLSADPRYRDLAASDYGPLETGPSADTGVDLGLDVNGVRPGDFDGSAPDRGAIESY